MRYFSFFWALAVGLCHFGLTLGLWGYYVAASGSAPLTIGTTEADCYRGILWIWSPLMMRAQDSHEGAIMFLSAIYWSIAMASVSGFFVAAGRRWRRNRRQRRSAADEIPGVETRTAPRRWRPVAIATAVILLEIGWAKWLHAGLLNPERSLTLPQHFHFRPMARVLQQASSFALHEGRPREEFNEGKLIDTIRARQPIQVDERPLRPQPFTVSREDQEALRAIVAASGSYAAFAGGKLCGGFHPDYLLTWNASGTTCHLLLCLGCGEMLLYDGKDAILVSIRFEAYQKLVAILSRYGINARDYLPALSVHPLSQK
jgi:hypothetical protein